MPSASQARAVDTSNLRRVTDPTSTLRGVENPPNVELPNYLTQSPVMIASLPPLATTPVDSALRQFYGPHMPVRRVLLP